ncbi:hypothetical protein Tsubulata_000921 [Turnera subulata]|uniref:Exonuclease domain-containing protein n=1 Tax=Turnera subulata TaxID=218843 RepID=A0A9Q0G369_9ROSI|nr:hypothetical protein Tsubulata_000921 [Turnera subulata]
MALSSFPLSRVPWFGGLRNYKLPPLLLGLSKTPPQNSTLQTVRGCIKASSTQYQTSPPPPPPPERLDNHHHHHHHNHNRRWRPLCLYHTQGRCTKVDDTVHLEKFNHDCASEFPVKAGADLLPQDFDFFLVLDLEGKVEILEFPVLMIDSKTLGVVDLFHRFVRPTAMTQHRIDEYIRNKYGKLGLDRVWHDTALPFNEVLQQFESWLIQHNLWSEKRDGRLTQAAFVTCCDVDILYPSRMMYFFRTGVSGNWDVKTQVPRQCEAKGMRSMMEQLKIPMMGGHHLGIDDTKNIARVLLRMLEDGAVIPITAWRNPESLLTVNFLYKSRVV